MSATVRVRTPSLTRGVSPASGPGEILPLDGLSPTRPQQAAGIRSEPPPSPPWATGTPPAATAAADPPEEPPGVRDVSHGFRVGPVRRGSVVGRMPNSGMVVRPMGMNPASFSRLTEALSWRATWSLKSAEPRRRGSPVCGAESFYWDRNAGERARVGGRDPLSIS